jgi:hypothetical protein
MLIYKGITNTNILIQPCPNQMTNLLSIAYRHKPRTGSKSTGKSKVIVPHAKSIQEKQ